MMIMRWGNVQTNEHDLQAKTYATIIGLVQAIIWANAGLLSIGQLWSHISEIWIKLEIFFTPWNLF